MRYRRNYQKGGCFFFTVVTAERRPWLAESADVAVLRQAMRRVKKRYPFAIDAIVILPDHLHTVWTLPPHDADFSLRWRLIKGDVARHSRHPKPLWQRRFWEHTIRDADDYAQHLDYIHYNPVKHGYVDTPGAWPYSSFHRAVRQGRYPLDWGHTPPAVSPAIGHE
ncbi:transposase [Salinisphaera sp.]|uniref:REP-associated tyrosine transposase n=1 Tax=Salinisphaera sp. TaxID=1914330 RepID=UPI000C3BD509|nr:transposase [Salinisphaera sp.]MBS62460.1 transposase [Salinisphaera sp.]